LCENGNSMFYREEKKIFLRRKSLIPVYVYNYTVIEIIFDGQILTVLTYDALMYIYNYGENEM